MHTKNKAESVRRLYYQYLVICFEGRSQVAVRACSHWLHTNPATPTSAKSAHRGVTERCKKKRCSLTWANRSRHSPDLKTSVFNTGPLCLVALAILATILCAVHIQATTSQSARKLVPSMFSMTSGWLWLVVLACLTSTVTTCHYMSLHVTTRSRGVALFAPVVYRVRHNS